MLATGLPKVVPWLDWSFIPATAKEATANARSTSEVWETIQLYLRYRVRYLPQDSANPAPARLQLAFKRHPGDTPTDMLEVVAFNQILQFPLKRSPFSWRWGDFTTHHFRPRRCYHMVMAVLTHAVGEQTCRICPETKRCTNCNEDGLPGCYTLPDGRMQWELAQVIGSACSNCILRKRRSTCDVHHHFHHHFTTHHPRTTMHGALESNESQRPASVPASSDHILPDEGSVPPAPSSSRANNKKSLPADTHVLLPGEGLTTSRKLITEVCELANLFATFRTVGDQQEFIESIVEPLTTPGVNCVVTGAITFALDLSQSEREKIVAVLKELPPMTHTKTHLLRLIALVYEQPAELQESLVCVIMNALSLRKDFHVGVEKAHKAMLLPESDRKGLLSILRAFRLGDSEE